jgi:hypothetical protein
MNWGKGIIVTFIVFAGIVTTMVVISMKQEVGLVAPDYYKQELAYQEQINRINNFNQLVEKPTILVDRATSEIVIEFPEANVNTITAGQVQLFRPSETGMDQLYELTLGGNGEQRILVSKLLKGRWKVKLSWQEDEVGYFNERSINL